MHKIVLLRHGESQWNKENRFTGWTDVDLSQKGVEEAQAAGQLLRDGGYDFDLTYTSVLKRAIRTLWIALDELDRMWLPVVREWRLNERLTATWFKAASCLLLRGHDGQPRPSAVGDSATLEQADHWLAQADKLHGKVGVGTLRQKIAMRLRALNPE